MTPLKLPPRPGWHRVSAKRKYRTFGEDDAKVRDTLIEKAARERVEAMESNTKKPGKMPHGFGTKQIKQFANSCLGLNIKEYDVDNRVRSIKNKEETERKRMQQVHEERAAVQRLEEVRVEAATARNAFLSSSMPRINLPASRSAL